MKTDMKFGWKPTYSQHSGQKAIGTAPIPLMYNFETAPKPVILNPETQKPVEPLYLGPRFPTNQEMHRQFANLKSAPFQGISSYAYEFEAVSSKPKKKSEAEKLLCLKKEKPRKFTGMNPGLVDSRELKFDANFESGNLDYVIKRA